MIDGNVTQRQDNNAGLNENFYYDADNRLDHSTLNGTVNLQMTYDGGNPGPGNITARSDVAAGSAWTYDPVRKHAVTQAGTGGYAFTYDANGNAVTRNGYNITWSSYNYPISINGLNKNVSLYYGPNRQYYEQVYTDGSSTEKTIYVGGLLEKVTLGSLVDWRHYIRVNNELIAIMSRQSSGTNVTHYVLSDHEGSIAELTDGSGATTVGESFSAFGTRRNPGTWSGIPSCPDLCTIKAISREGYTGHDAMGGVSLGLNHMNGRVQDAITGRFLSPDPNVPDPGNPQSWNRYSYVNNNPLTLTDPSGFDDAVILPYDTDYTDNAAELGDITVTAHRLSDINQAAINQAATEAAINALAGGQFPNQGPGGETLEPVTVTGKRPPPVKSTTPPSFLPYYPGFGQQKFVLPGVEDQTAQSPQHILGCFAKGAAVGAVAAVGVGALAVGAVVLGAPIAAVTAVLGVAGVAGGAFAVANTAVQLNAGNYAGAAFNVGSIAGGAAVGASGGGRALAQGINGVSSPPWSIGSDLSQGYNPNLGSVGDWLATGPNPGSAAATATGVGAAISQFLSGCN